MALLDTIAFLLGGSIPIIIILLIIAALMGIRIVRQWEGGVRFRLGRYRDVLQPGLRVIIPFIDLTAK